MTHTGHLPTMTSERDFLDEIRNGFSLHQIDAPVKKRA